MKRNFVFIVWHQKSVRLAEAGTRRWVPPSEQSFYYSLSVTIVKTTCCLCLFIDNNFRVSYIQRSSTRQTGWCFLESGLPWSAYFPLILKYILHTLCSYSLFHLTIQKYRLLRNSYVLCCVNNRQRWMTTWSISCSVHVCAFCSETFPCFLRSRRDAFYIEH
jgi:hypothetical protein